MFFYWGLFFQGLRMLKEATTRGGPAWVDTSILGWINKQKSDHVWWNLKCNLIICWFSFDMLLQVTEEQLAAWPWQVAGRRRMEKFCCCNKVQDIMLFEFPSSHWMRMYLFWLFFFSEFWSTRSDDTLPGGCWLKRCRRQSRRTFTMGIVRYHFRSAFVYYFRELFFLCHRILVDSVVLLLDCDVYCDEFWRCKAHN